MKNTDIITRLTNNDIIASDAEFKLFSNYFLSEKNNNERLNLYKEVKKLFSLTDEKEAKYMILTKLLGDYIITQLDLAQEISESNIKKSNIIVNKISTIKNIFKEYDVKGFVEYVCDIVGDTTPIEINKIFQQKELNSQDILKLKSMFQKTLIETHIPVEDDLETQIINHPLIELLHISRKIDYSKSAETLGRFAKLAHAIHEFRKSSFVEGLDGAITYLIYLDVTQGISNVKEPKELVKFIQKINNDSKITNKDIENLMQISFKRSINFIENEEGYLQIIENGNNTLKATGAIDRNYNNKLFIHSATNKATELTQSSQLSRGMEMYLRNIQQNQYITNDILPISIQISKDLSIPPLLAGQPINIQSQALLSMLGNFADILPLQFELEQQNNDIDLLKKCPIQIYSDKQEVTSKFNNLYLSLETAYERVIEIAQGSINILNKIDYFNNTKEINKVNVNTEKTEILFPLMKITETLCQHVEETPDSPYQQITSNLIHFFNTHKETLLNTESIQLRQQLKSFFKIIKNVDFDLLEDTPISLEIITNVKEENDIEQELNNTLNKLLSTNKGTTAELQHLENNLQNYINNSSIFNMPDDITNKLRQINSNFPQFNDTFKTVIIPKAYEEIISFQKSTRQGTGIHESTLFNAIDQVVQPNTNINIKSGNNSDTNKLYQLLTKIGTNDIANKRVELLVKLAYMSHATLNISSYKVNQKYQSLLKK